MAIQNVLEAYGSNVIGGGGGSSSGGHTIQNSAGTDLPQEDKMQFVDSHVSDDPTNGRTIVENIKEVSPADYDSTTDEGIIVTDDGDDALIGAVSDDYVEVTADGEKTYVTLLNELFALVDMSKLNNNSIIVIENNDYSYYYIQYIDSSSIEAEQLVLNASGQYKIYRIILSSSSSHYRNINGTITDISTVMPSSGTKITLYYGNKKAVVDLQTTANRCLYDSNTTVKQKIDAINNDVEDLKEDIQSLKLPRRKNLGTFTSQAQLESFLSDCGVSSGKFDGDIQIGDYMTIAGYKCIVAGFDTEYNKGDTALTTHHITFIADLGSSKMNETNTTTGGYEGAATMQSFLSSKETELTAICGSHLLSRRVLTTNSVGTDGKSSSWAWNTHKLTLMSETQIYGSIQWGNAYDTGEGYEKLPIFNYLTPLQVFGRAYVWLRGVYSTTYFCMAGYGYADLSHASGSLAAGALFCIG